MIGVGNMLGYLFGYADLPKLLPFLGDTQFKVLCAFASIALGGTVLISCLFIKERDPNKDGPPPEGKAGIFHFFVAIIKSIKKLPPQTRKVCEVQFFSWIGWFPFLFYITTYIGEIYVASFNSPDNPLSKEEVDALWEKATRIGTLALLIFAITSFASNIILPFLVRPAYGSHEATKTRTQRILDKLVIPWLSLRRAWLLSQFMYAILMGLTYFVSSTWQATAIVGLCGLPWALQLWAPFALISAEISKRETIRRGVLRDNSSGRLAAALDDDCEDQAGIILGLHNVAIAAPQVIATLGSSLIFKLLQKERGSVGDNSSGWVLRAGGIAALVATYMISRVYEEGAEAGVVSDVEGFAPILQHDEGRSRRRSSVESWRSGPGPL
jgi:solute carrier family 45, member 1/2/4